jgi:HAD superfamily hydrolase (TIGR01484 family)
MRDPRPIQDIPARLCRGLTSFFTDIDDTITEGGLVTAESFSALWDLHRAGLELVVVTGRPAGWCDHIARMWPVDGVIGENGAFYYAYDRAAHRMLRRSLIAEEERREGLRRLERVRERVLEEVPGCGIAADQPFRLVDLAVDFREDVEPLGEEAVDAICRIAAEEGAVSKVSSIHVNCWYGGFDKVGGVRRFLGDRGRDLSDERVRAGVLFTGDSPNDEPMFRELPHTVAVANIRRFLPRLAFPPAYVTTRPSARGFAEAVAVILGKRRG